MSIFEHKYIKKDCRLTGEYLKSYNSFVGKIVFLQNNNWLTFDRNHTLSCFFSPHGKNEDKPIHTNFWYPQGQSVFPIHNTIGQNRSWRTTYSFHTKPIISVSVSMHLRIGGSSPDVLVKQCFGYVMTDDRTSWNHWIFKSPNHWICSYPMNRITVSANVCRFDFSDIRLCHFSYLQIISFLNQGANNGSCITFRTNWQHVAPIGFDLLT